MIDNPSEKTPSTGKDSTSLKNESKKEESIVEDNMKPTTLHNNTHDNCDSTKKPDDDDDPSHQSDSHNLPELCNGTHVHPKENHIPNTSNSNSKNEISVYDTDIQCYETKESTSSESEEIINEFHIKKENITEVQIPITASTEQSINVEKVVTDILPLNQPEIFDDFLTDVPCSTNHNVVEISSQFALNESKNSDEHLTGQLIDISLTDCQNTPSNPCLIDIDISVSRDNKNDVNTIYNSELLGISNDLKGFENNSQSKHTLETNTCLSEKQCDNTNEHKEILSMNLDKVQFENSNQNVISRGSIDVLTQENNQQNNPDAFPSEIVKYDPHLKEKIGNSIKLMFDYNDQLNLNLFEKEKIATLQTNTLQKVNNLFSSFKSYNFSNFRNNEENLLKNKTSPVDQPKHNILTKEENKDHGENLPCSIRPLQNGQSIVSVNNVDNHETKSHFGDVNSTLAELNSKLVNNTTEEQVISIDNGSGKDTRGNSETELNNGSKVLISVEERNPTRDLFKTEDSSHNKDLVSDQDESTSKKLINVQEGFTLNTDLIHTVRNASHVKNKSISLNSSPVRHSQGHDVQDELYLLKETNIRLLGEISWLEEEKNKMKKDFRTFLEETELYKKSMNEQILEHEHWKQQNKVIQEARAHNFSEAKKELETKVEKLKKDFETANKDKEASVMRYVTKEIDLINAKKEKEQSEKKLKDVVKEKENVVNKLKVLTTDKARLTQLYDDKCTEYNILQRSLDKVSDEVTGKDIKLKWVQSKLDKELETSKVLAEKLKAMEDKQNSHQEEQSRLKFSEDSQRLFLQEIEVLKKKHQASTEENNALSLKVQRLEKERLESDQNLSKVKGVVISQNEEISKFREQLANMEDLKNQLHVEHERLLAKDTEVDRVQKSNTELSQDMVTCRTREAELLQFTEKLTAKNVRLQSEFSALEAKAESLEKQVQPLTGRVKALEAEIEDLQVKLEEEKLSKDGDNKALARVVAEKTKQVEVAAKEVEELRSENQIMKRKHASTLRELNKELSQLKRKCESVTNNDAMGDTHTLGYGSRTSSCQSLNEVQHSPTSASLASTLSSTLQMEPDRNVIIERLVELQRSHAKTIEKMEFLEEHNAQLVNELQKKTKILQNYILREQSGALTSRSMDVNKAWMNLMTKAEVSRHGGIMASLYSSKPADGGMTLDLSLEINRKLQAVLEDTILKNITLKENIDTLGEQIEKLSRKS